jgi:hypothetical protein
VRHLYGSALAIVMVAVMFFAGAWGYLRLLGQPAMSGPVSNLPAGGGSLLSNSTLLLALGAVAATAALAGLLVLVPWFSPLAAGLPGLLFLAWTGLYLASVKQAVQLIPLRSHPSGAGAEALLFNGILAAAGVVMVLPLFVPARWRGRRRRLQATTLIREADDFLADVKTAPEGGKLPRRERTPALVGTVLPRPSGAFPQAPAGTSPLETVDTTRITGASRVLRTTGSFRATTGNVPGYSGWPEAERPGYDQGYGDDRNY